MALIPMNHVMGFDEVLIENEDGRNQNAVKLLENRQCNDEIEVSETDAQVIIKGKTFNYVYSKKNGMFEQITFAGRNYLDKPMETNIWRAPTDNDMYAKLEWKKAHYDEAYIRAYDTVVQQSKDGVEIKTNASVSAWTVQKIMDIEI